MLVKVRAAALNRADLAVARGIPHGRHGGIGAAVGLEWAGEVVETGAEVEGYAPGNLTFRTRRCAKSTGACAPIYGTR